MKGKSSEKFLVIMSILTFLVVLVGATFAYFTAKARSDNEALDMASHFVEVAYSDGRELQSNQLIPTSKNVAMASYNGLSEYGQCRDDNNMSVCSIYKFEVTNLGSISQSLGALINIDHNGFKSLNFSLFNVTNANDIYDASNKIQISEGTFPNTIDNPDYLSNGVLPPFYIIGNDNQIPQTLAPGVTEKYELVIYLYDNYQVQNYEQGKEIAGTVTVSLTDSSHVKGYIEEVEE